MSQDDLQRKLKSDAPKCANCQHWKDITAFGGSRSHGLCHLNAATVPALPQVTDLSVCSAWEQK